MLEMKKLLTIALLIANVSNAATLSDGCAAIGGLVGMVGGVVVGGVLGLPLLAFGTPAAGSVLYVGASAGGGVLGFVVGAAVGEEMCKPNSKPSESVMQKPLYGV